MNGPVSRRRLLGGALAGTAGLAGCLQQPPRRTSRALLVTNATEDFFTVTVRLYALPEYAGVAEATPTVSPTEDRGTGTGTTRQGDPPTDDLEQVFVRRKDLAPEAAFGVDGSGLPDGDLRVQVTTTNDQSDSYDWARVDERSTLDVRIVADAVRFTEVD